MRKLKQRLYLDSVYEEGYKDGWSDAQLIARRVKDVNWDFVERLMKQPQSVSPEDTLDTNSQKE